MDINFADIYEFVVTNKMWFIVAIPAVLAIMVIKARG
jgi:hypothetical protein